MMMWGHQCTPSATSCCVADHDAEYHANLLPPLLTYQMNKPPNNAYRRRSSSEVSSALSHAIEGGGWGGRCRWVECEEDGRRKKWDRRLLWKSSSRKDLSQQQKTEHTMMSALQQVEIIGCCCQVRSRGIIIDQRKWRCGGGMLVVDV